MEDYNLTKQEVDIIAPKKNVFSEGFKGSVTLCATVFFGEKILQRLVTAPNRIINQTTGVYAMIAGLVGGAAAGVVGAIKYNKKLKTFTDKLEAASKAAETEKPQNSR